MMVPQLTQLLCTGAGDESQDFELPALGSSACRGTGYNTEYAPENESTDEPPKSPKGQSPDLACSPQGSAQCMLAG